LLKSFFVAVVSDDDGDYDYYDESHASVAMPPTEIGAFLLGAATQQSCLLGLYTLQSSNSSHTALSTKVWFLLFAHCMGFVDHCPVKCHSI